MSDSVRIWSERVNIPTYGVGEPNPNPMFLEKRVYQGSSGRVYPYPVIDKILDEKIDKPHDALFLENRYLKVMVLPQYGGRIHAAYDKTNGYPFIYHNKVIKPALVGLAGPWLSGGIEFNWPQHHRPGTFCPVDWAIRDNRDGSMTLVLSEIEPMWHMKGTLLMTLFPDRALLEIAIRLYNRTALPQSFHLWTNPAVHVNDDYQSVFPPDVQAVYDHGKRDVSSFPIARGTYYKIDYSKGVDISWYKNLPVPTSYMAAKSDYDFLGGYDHGKQAGVLHIANHHEVPGKKQWVWGCGEFGKAWDRNLTDEDGPYAELMCGVFADNQPDFSWLMPFEEKSTKQYFMPYKGIGYVRNATTEAAVSLEIEKGVAKIGAYVTSPRPGAMVRLWHEHELIWKEQTDLDPEHPLTRDVPLKSKAPAEQYVLQVLSAEGKVLVDYRPEPKRPEAVPDPAKAIPEPRKVESNEALYLAGLHLEQYRHATREPADYYEEALRRDPTDARCNNAMGLLLMRRGQFEQAEPYFRAAIKTLTKHNPNPYDGEAFYNLGVCLRFLGGAEPDAYDAFYKATWNAAWQAAAFFQLAQMAALFREPHKALDFVEKSLQCNAINQRATHLKIMLLRKLGRGAEALALAEATIARDPLDFGALFEWSLLLPANQRAAAIDKFNEFVRNDAHTRIEIACDYGDAGAYDEALEILDGPCAEDRLIDARPMLHYFAVLYSMLTGDADGGWRHLQAAMALATERCFPNSLHALVALDWALESKPDDPRALYYLGNLFYDKRQVDDAIKYWEQCRKADPTFPTVHRNLALAYFNKRNEPARAMKLMEKAFALNPADARVLYELDLLRRRMSVPPEERRKFLDKHFDVVQQREDLLVEYITLLNCFGEHEKALDLVLSRQFHPWEGGEGKVTGQYVTALVELARQDLAADRAREALVKLVRARTYPESLGEGKLHGAQENHILYLLGLVHESLGDTRQARCAWQEAATGMTEPTPAVYYNDQNPETIYYQGLALLRLQKTPQAKKRFATLVDFARKHRKDNITIDYFAVSLPEFVVFEDDLNIRSRINCHMLAALGLHGLGKIKEARKELSALLKLDPGHPSALLHRRWLNL